MNKYQQAGLAFAVVMFIYWLAGGNFDRGGDLAGTFFLAIYVSGSIIVLGPKDKESDDD